MFFNYVVCIVVRRLVFFSFHMRSVVLNTKFLQCMNNHCGFTIFSLCELHLFVLSELCGFLGSLFAVVLRVVVLPQFDIFQ